MYTSSLTRQFLIVVALMNENYFIIWKSDAIERQPVTCHFHGQSVNILEMLVRIFVCFTFLAGFVVFSPLS